jgi:beige protein homolog 1
MICRGGRITLYSLNGSLLIDQVICETDDDCIISCAFYEGESNEWLERELLFTGHKRGVVNVRYLLEMALSLSLS